MNIFLHRKAYAVADLDLKQLTINILQFTSQFIAIDYLWKSGIASETLQSYPDN